MSAGSFDEIAAEVARRIERTVWCTVATEDPQGRLRSRILHPLWDGATGWLLTGRQSAKAKDLAHNPYVAITYWDQANEQLHIDCRTHWEERPAEKRRIWDVFKTTPAPMGYDPGLFFPGPDDASFGVLVLEPWRVELWSLADLMTGKQPRVWKAASGASPTRSSA